MYKGLLEVAMLLQHWGSYRGRNDVSTIKQFTTVTLSYSEHHSCASGFPIGALTFMALVVCSPDALLGDCATQQLVRLIESKPDQVVDMGLSLPAIITECCAALGARHDALKGLQFFETDPLGAAVALQRHGPVAVGRVHRAQCAARYVKLLSALAS